MFYIAYTYEVELYQMEEMSLKPMSPSNSLLNLTVDINVLVPSGWSSQPPDCCYLFVHVVAQFIVWHSGKYT